MELSIDLTKKLDPKVKEASYSVTDSLNKAGFEAYLVGGSVRDLILEKKLTDLDFTTDATPQEVMKIFPRTVPVGIKFGTVLVLYKKIPIEVTTYRTDLEYYDHRRPSKVKFGKNLKEDVLRRDFTMNGMAYDLKKKILIDEVGGLKDIRKKNIQTIGQAELRFKEDGLRPIRACRFAAVLGFTLTGQARRAARRSVSSVKGIARERFYDEWRKVKVSKSATQYVFWKLLYEMDILEIFMDNVSFFKHANRRKSFFNLLSNFPPRNMGMYLAFFFEFEYFFKTKNTQVERKNSKKVVKSAGKNLRFPFHETKKGISYLNSPLFSLLEYKKWLPIKMFPLAYLVASIEEDELEDHIYFFLAIQTSKIPDKKDIKELKESLKMNVEKIREKGLLISKKKLKINGHDLGKMGYEKAEIGRELEKLHKIIIRHPSMNHTNVLIHLAGKHLMSEK